MTDDEKRSERTRSLERRITIAGTLAVIAVAVSIGLNSCQQRAEVARIEELAASITQQLDPKQVQGWRGDVTRRLEEIWAQLRSAPATPGPEREE